MGRIYYTAEKYTGIYSHINSIERQQLNCKKFDLYRAVMTVGCPSFISWEAILQNGLMRVLSNSIVQKILLVHDNIDLVENNLVLHPIFQQQVSDQR